MESSSSTLPPSLLPQSQQQTLCWTFTSAPNAEGLVEALREEASAVLREHNGVWTKQAISKLYRLDSAIRESARMSGIGGTAMARKVKVPGGMTLPDGTWVPANVTIGVAMDGIHLMKNCTRTH